MNVLVTYESRGGRTRQVAQAVAEEVGRRGHEVAVKPMSDTTPEETANADHLFIGSWVEGFILFGVHPAHAASTWIAGMPTVDGKPASVFCTYAVNPRNSLTELSRGLQAHGAKVTATRAFHRSHTSDGVDSFVDAALSSGAQGPVTE